MDNQHSIITTLKRYADGRNQDCKNSLETAPLAALLVEKYACGMVDVIRTLNLDVDTNAITTEANILCQMIDPDVKENRQLRYERVSKLDLSEKRLD